MASKFTVPYAPSSVYRANNSIADLMLRAGAINAEGARRSGEIWGATLANVGQQVGGAVAQYQQDKQQKRADEEMAKQDAAFVGLLSKSEGIPDPRAVISIYGPKRGMEVAKGLAAFGELGQKRGEEALKSLPTVIRGAQALSEPLRAKMYPMLRDKAIATGLFPAESVPEQYDPETWGQIVAFGQSLEAPKEDAGFTLSPDQVRFDASGKQIAVGPAKPPEPPKPPTSIDAAIVAADAKGDQVEVKRLLNLKRLASAATEAPREADAAPTLTGPAMDIAAKMYLQTGTLPPMGMGKEGAKVRQAIINRAAELDPAANIAANKAGYGSDASTLTQLKKQRSAIGAFEETAKKNIDIFLDTAGKVVDTGSPMANALARQVSGKMLGSKDQAAYDAARQVAINEIAKITSNPTLAGQLSDTARKEIEAFNPAGATLAQTVAVMRLLKRDMGNRITSLDDAIGEVEIRLGGKKSARDPVIEEWVRDSVTGKLRKK